MKKSINKDKAKQMAVHPTIIHEKMNFEGCSFETQFKFSCGHAVPVYKIDTTSAFNQIVGFAKFVNSDYGNVYYRGISSLYDNVLPSLMRNRAKGMSSDLNDICKKISTDARLKSSLKLRDMIKCHRIEEQSRLNKNIKRCNKYTVEALLQHYVGATRFLDVVDNHWIALWMGLYCFSMHGKRGKYCSCTKRKLRIGDMLEQKATCLNLSSNKDIFVYVLLIAMPHATSTPQNGITETDDFVEVDLRKALPSIYLRPHAQHALVVRRRDKQNINQAANYYDMAQQVVGILKIRIDIADEWLGNGELMTEKNIFPSPSVDQGYNTLLMRNDIFVNPFEIIRYY